MSKVDDRPPKPVYDPSEPWHCNKCGKDKSRAEDFETPWARDHWYTRHECRDCRNPIKHPKPKGRRKDADRIARIKTSDQESKRRAMLNASRNAVNLPLIQRMDLIQKTLAEIISIDPEDAATMMSPWRCRQFTDTLEAVWWTQVTKACTERFSEAFPEEVSEDKKVQLCQFRELSTETRLSR